MILDVRDWMQSWGWRATETLGKVIWEKVSPSGLIIAQQGDSTWDADSERAVRLEQQLIGTRVQ